mmetsp:Transcript_38606/g.52441  ORF Transcript_38606/g.52441 Transcript_38606/m.52441 type:complete len:93 (+) Transcript_38606:660-938(+)|eukprot:CAMPEP_0176341552 /NCGR_PEP_ID=MMETSP0126-20121128/2468_1 /TAXON_ID=141414 ORGANISM="Strombidinopsis acuminatum, Strain SPMC142" /NCGR_SAMPLE_ID=MMETSP0126 /ASSEMBLY_ACC=CAM_ASM_000229 /LENGTH=92 /DNA_ID=CAMNT_0017686435 /DNA_START=2099 /DNA_END=2377 /DNA_ORIENTATION=-
MELIEIKKDLLEKERLEKAAEQREKQKVKIEERKKKNDDEIAAKIEQQRLERLAKLGKNSGTTASNAWVVSGAYTPTGKPIVSSDPHTALFS